MRRRSGWTLAALLLCAVSAHVGAQTVRYIYDELGRLVGVIDQNGASAVYQYDAVGNLLSISRPTPGTVTIIEFTPNGAPVGTAVSLYGTGFSATSSENTVTFNGTTATVSASTTTSISTTVPAGATTGAIAVTTPSGSASSSTSFQVTSAAATPTVSSFTPSIGVAGTTIAITGTNFDAIAANNRLKVNLTQAATNSSTTTSIGAGIPSKAASGRITVTTPTGTATSSTDFFIAPPPFVASDVQYTGRTSFSQAAAVAIPTATKIGLLVFDGTAGQRVSVKIVPGPIGTAWLYRPDGLAVTSISVGTLTTLIEPQSVTQTGTYSVLIDPLNNGTGTTNVTPYDVPADISGSITADGTPASVTMNTPGQNGSLTFGGTSAHRMSVDVSSGVSAAVSMHNPAGAALASVTSGVMSTFIEPVTLDMTGSHTLRIDPTGANTGSLTLKLYDVPADLSGSITAGGTPVTLTTTTPGQNGSLTFSGTSGHRMSVDISSGVSANVSMRNPAGTALASVSSGVFSSFIEPVTLDTTDSHTLRMDPVAANTGSLTFKLYDVPADTTGTVTVGGSAIAVSPGTPGQNGTLTFSGTASQQVTVRVTNNTISSVTVKLQRANGTVLTSTTSSFASFNLATKTLPATETYTIVVDPTKAATGSANVSVTTP